ncbi:hypothetical protein SARC_08395 [Sphaeroforma arctica JP610]|uniref:Uncharacterized protein n=1 Tax=Sphaeroforma arctica JP610 TaxID=667725 RepID=A0A0L0FRK9_9EUKA|nr:hypothetical protein SARC_08395 [Sphaeroforma arctica JP610]KNC79196.1 hypothetical protein SARC_08395 [Sphaeroforma arctica JP610]|eukprot:XP_014153098.1 hypothetical protein SARC_08395 [Sphaeroforma arctica JP610]
MYGPRELYEQTSLTTWDTIVPQLSTKLNVLSVRIRGANTLLLVRMTDDALTTIYNLTKPQMMKMSIIKYSLLHFTSLALDDADRKIMTGMDSASDSNTNPSSSSTDYLAIASLVLWLVCMLLLCPLLAYTVYRCYKARQSSATSEEDRLKKEMDTMTQKFAIARGASTLSGMSVPSRVGSIRESFMGGSTSTYSMGTSNSSLQGDPSRPAERTLSVNSALSQQDIARMRLEQQIIVKEAKAKKPLLRIPLQGSSTTLDLGSSSSMGSPSFNGLSAGESLDSSSVNSKSMTSSGYSRSLSTGSLRGKEPEIANDGSASRSVSLSKKMSVKNPLHRVIIEPF